MPEWSLAEMVAVTLLAGIPLASLVGWLRRMMIDVRAERRLHRVAVEREERRRPAPGTLVLEGRVVPQAGGVLEVVTRRQFGCLGGPLIHDVPAFEIELEDGTRRHVEVGEDPVVENIELLAKPAVAAGAAVELLVPMNSGANESVALLSGRVRVAGMVVDGERYKSPPGASAVLTILDPT